MNDRLAEAIDQLKDYREAVVRVAAAAGMSTDMPPITHFYRDDRLLALIVARTVNRDTGLKWTYFGAAGFSADAVLQCQDTFATTDPKLLSRRLEAGELERLVRAGKAEEHQIHEMAVLVWTERGDTVSTGVQIPYEIVGDKVLWGEPHEMLGVTGRLNTAAVNGFKEPTGKHKLADLQQRPDWNDIYDGEPGDELLHTDLGFARSVVYLASDEVEVVYLGADERERQIVAASFAHMTEQIESGEFDNLVAAAIAQHFANRENPN